MRPSLAGALFGLDLGALRETGSAGWSLRPDRR